MSDIDEFFESIRRNDVVKVKDFLMRGIDVNSKRNGVTPLHVAVEQNNLPIVETLLEYGANPDVISEPTGKSQLMYTPLQLALSSKQINYLLINALIKHGANVNLTGNSPHPLALATLRRDPKLVKLILDAGADIGIIITSKEQRNCVMNVLAITGVSGDIETAKILIQYGARVDQSGENLITPYHTAAAAGQVRFLKFLMDIYHEPNIIGCHKRTPLFRAVEANLETTKYLVDEGADINAVDSFGNTPLAYAAYAKKLDIVNYLKKKGAIAMVNNKEVKF
ncbi:hypothetical protein HS7_14700 [Sulfolobales archaeon HS-7]|nr:hypothetical protein HS7_14700 [Sulfolobales archaeon HS-7]